MKRYLLSGLLVPGYSHLRAAFARCLMPLAASCLIANVGSAEDFVVFHDDFNLDTVAEWPNLTPPGDPANDLMFYDGLVGSDPGTAIVHDSYLQLTDQPLVVTRPVTSHIAMYFTFDSDHVDCGSYTVTWDAMAGNAVEYVYFTLREEGYRFFTALEFREDPALPGQGPITLGNAIQTTSVRWYAAQAQHFEFVVNIDASTYSLAVDGIPVPEAQDHIFLMGNHDGTFGHMGLQFGLMKEAVMAFDNLHVVAHCDEVSVESSTWGSVKSSYRR